MVSIAIFSHEERGRVYPGILVDGFGYDSTILGGRGYASVQDILDDWEAASESITALGKGSAVTGGRDLGELNLVAPIAHPKTIYCAGANYKDHVANLFRIRGLPPEPDPKELGLNPWHFIKSSQCIVGPGATVVSSSSNLDWEVELAAVIGIGGKDIPLEAALSHVAGYTIANDLSARDKFFREGMGATSPFKFDWLGHKNFDGACPLGPWIVPACEVEDPQSLWIKLWVNDRLCQDSSTNEMTFSIAEQISYMSTTVTLQPGDIFLTGTPAGTGSERGERLTRGDSTRAAIEGLGELITYF